MYEGWVIDSLVGTDDEYTLMLSYGALRHTLKFHGPIATEGPHVSPTKNSSSTQGYSQIDLYDALSLSKMHAADIIEQHPRSCEGEMQLSQETEHSKTSRCLTCGTRVISSLSSVEVAAAKRL